MGGSCFPETWYSNLHPQTRCPASMAGQGKLQITWRVSIKAESLVGHVLCLGVWVREWGVCMGTSEI